MSNHPLNIVCVSRFFKGSDFIKSMKACGNIVYLLTSTKHQNEAWPWEAIEETFYMEEDENGSWNMAHVINGLAYKMRTVKYDRFISLDDFDVEKVAHLREHFRIPGMGETTSRYFRDKLAMRIRAKDAGILVPHFTSLFSDDDIRQFTESVQAPWLIKPRTAASAMGIKKIHTPEELWIHLDELGDQRHHYLLEKFTPGSVYHVDGLNVNGNVIFSRASQYLDTPLEVAHGGGIFRSQTVAFGSEDEKTLLKMNEHLMKAFGMNYSASHTEFIKDHKSGSFYFLETSSRVGGANIAEMVEASSDINLWAEWAKIEDANARQTEYHLPQIKNVHSGIIVSLSRFEYPDDSSFSNPEISWRMNKKWHIGMIIKSDDRSKIESLLDAFAKRISEEFHASLPQEKPPTN